MSRQLLRNSLTGFGGMALHKLIHLVTMIALARMLGTEQFGVYAFVGSVVFFLGFLTDLGMERVLTRELSARPQKASVLLGTALWLRFGLGLVAALTGLVVGWGLQLDRTTFACLLLAAGGLPFGFDLLARSYFQSTLRVQHYYRVSLGGSSSFLVLVLACWWWGASVVSVFAAGLANGLVVSFVFLAAVHWQARIHPRFDVKEVRTLLGEGIQVGLLALLFMAALRVDQILLFELRGPEEVGQYAAAVRLTEALGMFSEALMLSLFPLLAASHRSNPQLFRRRYQLGIRYLAAVGVPLALACSYFAPTLLTLVFGGKYRDAWPAVVLLSWNMLLAYLGAVYVNVFLIERRYRHLLLVSSLSVLVNVLCNLLWIPRYGGPGAAAATLLSSVVALVLWFAFTATRTVMTDCMRASAPAVFAGMGAVIPALVLGWRSGPLWAIVTMGLYVVLLLAFGGLGRADWKRVSRGGA
ncbi:MAG: hypothetical protein KatS3mg077_3138 [Candidatus Binatia bacterium]|nr:MAG: hypothetical protein KatS3mg077_3138 [Candidatus Binatia bacterium]